MESNSFELNTIKSSEKSNLIQFEIEFYQKLLN